MKKSLLSRNLRRCRLHGCFAIFFSITQPLLTVQVCISIAVSLAVKQVKVRSDNNNLCMCTSAQKYAKTAVDNF